jgi:hypothetical protein
MMGQDFVSLVSDDLGTHGRSDRAARVLLRVIEREPEAVARALTGAGQLEPLRRRIE